MDIDTLTEKIIGAAIEVHRILGPGMLESAYKQTLAHELRLRNLKFKLEVPIPIPYKGIKLECGFRADIIVEDSVVIELKAQRDNYYIFRAQILTNTKLSGHKTGLLLNFYYEKLKEGISRFDF